MTNDGLNSLTYDGENRLVTSSGGTYTYDGKSLRVKKVASSTTTVYIFSGTKVIAEYDNGAAPGSPSREYIYSGLRLAATIDGSGTKYNHIDHLSARVTTDANGNVLAQQGHYPYGESWYAVNTTTKWQFTSYERDSESGNDYAMARYNVNRLGRFSSPDPVAGSVLNPQSLSRYSYVSNDSINGIDPVGLSRTPLDDDDQRIIFGLMGGGGLTGGGCMSDNVRVPCDLAYRMLNSGSAVQCPNNICIGLSLSDNRPVYFAATTNGPGRYYTTSGPGALFYSAEAAGTAAIDYINEKSKRENRKYAGEIYRDQNDIYSYTALRPGTVDSSIVDPNAIPEGTVSFGDYHTHGGSSLTSLFTARYRDENFSPGDLTGMDSFYRDPAYPSYRVGFVGTPGGANLGVLS